MTSILHAKILSLERLEAPALMPAPNVTDWEVIAAALAQTPSTNKGLMDGLHKIVTTYRGGLLYLDNGAVMYRYDTAAYSANGHLGAPVGEEGCFVGLGDEWWTARVVYE